MRDGQMRADSAGSAQDGRMFGSFNIWHLVIILLMIAAIVLFIAALVSIARAPRASTSEKVFTERVTVPPTWLFCSATHELEVVQHGHLDAVLVDGAANPTLDLID